MLIEATMKKLDYLIIGIVLMISIAFYFGYVSNKLEGDNISVQVLYNNDVIYSVDLKEDTNIEVSITGSNDLLKINADGQEYEFIYDISKDFYNTVSITYDEIKMIDASCKNHYCMKMRIYKFLGSPIVCTNGIVVKLVTSEIEIIS